MTSFESPGGRGLSGEQNRQEAIELPIPEDPDVAWCAIVTAAYGNGSYRTTIKTASYLRRKLPIRKKGLKCYENYSCEGPDGEPGEIEGVLVGAKMIPNFDDGPYVPHLVLVEADQGDVPYWIADHPNQEFLIPLSDAGKELFLHPE